MAGHDEARRAQVVTLKSYTKLSNEEISTITGVSVRAIQDLMRRVRIRGFDPSSTASGRLNNAHVIDAPRSSRARKATKDAGEAAQEKEPTEPARSGGGALPAG